jgi:methionyl-tRNA synthetase
MAKAKKTFFVTTAIDYVNAEPHFGHAYQKIAADVLARWHKLLGEDVNFLTGTDEHGKKVSNSAEKTGKTPKQFVDEIAQKFKEAWTLLEIEPTRFIRTTDKDHEAVVKEFIEKSTANGDIYKGKYSGLYCVGCEAYYTEKDVVNGECQYHPGKKLEQMEEETYFFRLSKYQDFLLDLYKTKPEFVLPDAIRADVITRVSEGLRDFSISRTNFDWGIPYPGDPKHVIYVWFDALINYYTPTKEKKNNKYWPADYHLLGRDNTWFHTVYWPAMLKSVGIEMPRTVFTHGFFTFNGQKISKSLGNSISPRVLVDKYGADTIRYYALRAVPFGEDGDFSEDDLVKRHNNELANKLGNLVSRVSTLVEKYGLEKDAIDETNPLNTIKLVENVNAYFGTLAFSKALNEIFAFIDKVNEYVQTEQPWNTQDKKVLWRASNAIKDVAILLSPFIPSASEKISKVFDFKIALSEISKPLKVSKVVKAEILFKKIDEKANAGAGVSVGTDGTKSVSGSVSGSVSVNKSVSSSVSGGVVKSVSGGAVSGSVSGVSVDSKVAVSSAGVGSVVVKSTESSVGVLDAKISYDDFAKLELKVGKILEVSAHPKADKLLVLKVDLGEKEPRTIVAGLKKFYSTEDLVGKKAVFVANLAPVNLRGIESNGMILAAAEGKDEKVAFLTPEKDVKEGSKVM